MASGKRTASAIRSQINARDLQVECTRDNFMEEKKDEDIEETVARCKLHS